MIIRGGQDRQVAHRCTRCEWRTTFVGTWASRPRRKKCARCGNAKFYVDKWMARRGRQQKCNCGGYWFPHRKGSKYCELHPKAEQHWVERYEAAA